MNEKIKKLINDSVQEIIENSTSNKKINGIFKKHNKKIHFIPKKYRVLGVLLQSMNIQFGNFIEVLMMNLIKNEKRYEIIKKYSGEKINSFKLDIKSENLIDEYILKCQTSDIDLEVEFIELQKQLFEISKENTVKKKKII